MSKFLKWKNAPATSNIAIFVPGVPNGGLVFAIEDEQGNVTSCKDGSIFSNFTVAGRRPLATQKTPAQTGNIWSVDDYEQLGLIIVKGDKVTSLGEVIEFSWREVISSQNANEYKGECETKQSGVDWYWRPLVMQNPRPATETPDVVVKVDDAINLEVVDITANDLGVSVGYKVETADADDYHNAHVSKYVELGLVMENTDEVDENGIVSEFSWRKHGVDQLYVTYKGAIEVKDEYWRPRVIYELKNDELMEKIKSGASVNFLRKTVNAQFKIKNSGAYGEHPVTTSVDILNQAVKEQGDRAATYDAPSGERSMGKTVAMFNILTGFNVTEEQGWQFMELLKMVRSSQGKAKADNYVDGSSYASLAGESALRDRGDKS